VSLWDESASALLSATASVEPTPGGGSIAAISGALGTGLVQMAIAITGDDALQEPAERLSVLRDDIAAAADGDVHDFGALMAAYRLPRGDDAEREARSRAVEAATIAAAERPLALVESLRDVLTLARELEDLVKPGIRSDVLAGEDLVTGAARAAVRTADINIDALLRRSSPAAEELRARRDALVVGLGETL